MVRVGGLQQKVASGVLFGSGADRTPPLEQLDKITAFVRQLTEDQHRCLYEDVLPALEKESIVLRRIKDLSEAERKHLRKVFHREIFPVLTPLAIDPGHPFPHLLNKSLNLAVLLHRAAQREHVFAVVRCRRCCRAS
jgi:polyphosphate kinase